MGKKGIDAGVVANINLSKNKSNSQLYCASGNIVSGCSKYQSFKEQKQFTTQPLCLSFYYKLQQISIFQRTKAIHNVFLLTALPFAVVANINLSKNKSNSQLNPPTFSHVSCCSKYQSFKEQKQFTTKFCRLPRQPLLQQISIFQRTKAIHNFGIITKLFRFVVANINLSKNKSNSQQIVFIYLTASGCSKYQSFKEQKQFTTIKCNLSISAMLQQISIFQRTKSIARA